MPMDLHEALVDIFRYEPSTAATVLSDAAKVALPAHRRARLDTNDAGHRRSRHRADAVVVLENAKGRPVETVVVEVQLEPDEEKYWIWPLYVIGVRARLRSWSTLVVVCMSDQVARWAARPIRIGVPGWWVMSPIVVGPAQIPAITDPEEARRRPPFAVLSAVLHREHADLGKILDAMLAGVDTLKEHEVERYLDIAYAGMTEDGQRDLEAKMTTQTHEYRGAFMRRLQQRWAESRAEGKVEGRVEGRAEGKLEGMAEGKVEGKLEGKLEGRVEGKVEALLDVLRSRCVEVPPEVEARITGCTDLKQLTIWVDRAATARSIHDVFD